jgi:hypothetical protein
VKLVSRQEALEQGLTRYFTGKPCKHGHVCERNVSNKSCHECSLIAGRKHDAANREKRCQKNKDWRERNSEKVKEKFKQYYQSNLEKERARTRKKYQDNIEAYKLSNKLWRERNADNERFRTAKRHAAKLQATPLWSDLNAIKQIYKEADRISKETGIKHEVDHIVPLQSNLVCGLHVPANLQILTKPENISKGNRHWPDMPE